MTAKTDALVRDLAAVFVKYRAADWAPIVVALSDGVLVAKLADAIGAAAHQADAARKPSKSKSGTGVAKRKVALKGGARPVEQEDALRFVGPNAEAIDRLREELLARALLGTVPALRAYWLALGLKTEAPKRREATIAELTRYLDTLDAAQFETALRVLMREHQRSEPQQDGDFQRWFNIITAQARD